MDLPDEKGTYILIASVPQMKRIDVGQLGEFDIVPGFYAYVGSAFGAGGLCARIGHRLQPRTRGCALAQSRRRNLPSNERT